MSDNFLLNRVGDVLRATFKQPNAIITRETTADMVSGWDSLSHAMLLMRMEEVFVIRFVPTEVVELENVGDLVDVVHRKLAESI